MVYVCGQIRPDQLSGEHMIKVEFCTTREDGVNLYSVYSDQNMKIRQEQTGTLYDSVIDVENAGFNYIETDIPRDDPIEVQSDLEEIIDILLGGDNE